MHDSNCTDTNESKVELAIGFNRSCLHLIKTGICYCSPVQPSSKLQLYQSTSRYHLLHRSKEDSLAAGFTEQSEMDVYG
jgi:hypothetical protein